MWNKISKLALKIFCRKYLTLKSLFLIFKNSNVSMYQSIYPSLCVFMYFKTSTYQLLCP